MSHIVLYIDIALTLCINCIIFQENLSWKTVCHQAPEAHFTYNLKLSLVIWIYHQLNPTHLILMFCSSHKIFVVMTCATFGHDWEYTFQQHKSILPQGFRLSSPSLHHRHYSNGLMALLCCQSEAKHTAALGYFTSTCSIIGSKI